LYRRSKPTPDCSAAEEEKEEEEEVVTVYTTRFNIKELCILSVEFMTFCMVLKTKSDYFSLHL
jgi:hypothetical protein